MKQYITHIAISLFVAGALVAVPAFSNAASTSTASTTQTSTAATVTAASTENCNQYDQAAFISGSINFTTNTASVENTSKTCTVKVHLASYNVYKEVGSFLPSDPGIATQKLFDKKVVTLAPKQKTTLTVSIPACAYQIDLGTGDAYASAPAYNSANFIDGKVFFKGGPLGNGSTRDFCGNEKPKLEITKSAPATVSIAADKTSTIEFTFVVKNTGSADAKNVVVTDAVQDGLTFVSANSSDKCSATSSTNNDISCSLGTINAGATVTIKVKFSTAAALACTDVYNTAKVKADTLIVVSSNTTKTHVDCPTTTPSNPTVVCEANPTTAKINETITWSATASGGSGSGYHFSWTGTDGLTASTATTTKAYSATGTKDATVTVTDSNGKTASKKCMVVITSVPVVPTNPSVVCDVSPSNANAGDVVTWSSTATGGSGSYSYSWAGTDNFSATTSSATKIYATAGTKTSTVTVTDSNGKSASKQCSMTVTIPTSGDFALVCSANPASGGKGTTVTWTATATGGTGTYTYSWSGDENLTSSSSTAVGTYPTDGVKQANVSVTSGGKTLVANCSMVITTGGGGGGGPSLDATCVANPTSATLNQSVTFTANPTGGSNYTYSWSGDDSISGTGQSVTKSYSTAGTKIATVLITSGSASVSRSCSVSVQSGSVTVSSVSTPNQVAGIYLTQIPYTGLKENALAGLVAMTLIGTLGLVSFTYLKKRGQYALVAAAQAQEASMSAYVANQHNVLVEAIESHARTLSASVSADAVNAIAKASKGNSDWAKSVVNQVVSAHTSNVEGWTLVTLDSIKKIYPHLG